MTHKKHILVIRLGALGDLVFCFQSFHEIRQAHPDAEIALLTRAPFAAFAGSLPWFDRVIIETHPNALQWGEWWRLVKEIKSFTPNRIYDLQGKRRQSILYFLLGKPEWSGAAPECKFPRPAPMPKMHFMDFLAAQLRVAKIQPAPKPNLDWFDAPVDKFSLPNRYAVLVPGCSPDALHKRWSPEKYADLAQKLQARGFACVIVGTNADADAVSIIKKTMPDIVDLCGQTSLFELAGILRRAAIVIGNDTGPLHMAATVGAPTVALFCGKSSTVWSKPPGDKVLLLQSENLADLRADSISAAVFGWLEKTLPQNQ